MKTQAKFSIMIMVMISCQTLFAQVSVGFKVGANMADTRISGFGTSLLPEQTLYPGWTTGLMAQIPLGTQLSFRPEINFIQKGFTSSESFNIEVLSIDVPIGATIKTRFNHIEAPLLLQYNFQKGPASMYAIAGPSVGYLAHGELRPVFKNILLDINLPRVPIGLGSFNRYEISGIVGLGGQIEVGAHGKIFGDVRYQYGFTNTLKNPVINLDVNNLGFQLAVGYAYTIGAADTSKK